MPRTDKPKKNELFNQQLDNAEIEFKTTKKGSGSEYLKVYSLFCRALGPTTGMYLSCLYSWYSFLKEDVSNLTLQEDNSFYRTQEKITYATGLTEGQQRRIVKELVNLGLLSTQRRGLPARLFYKFNAYEINKIITKQEEKDQNERTRPYKMKEQDLTK